MKTKEQVVPKWFKGEIYEEGDMVTNKFSGEDFVLNALELSIYDFIMGSQYVFEMAPKTITQKQVSEFQKALTWFRKNNVDAYFVLLD
jgi:hypothetical protein|tara:strand:- start:193 stop:456 length:264 start_codon:yes stop_codon:yes gene_type:complete